MSDSRPQRAREHFERALERPPAARDAFLEQACGADSALLEEVRSLLAAHAEVGGFLESAQAARALAAATAPAADPLVGAVIGGYRVLDLLARGGMGAVYRAEQEHPRREVALKLIDRINVTPELLRRFEVEAQLLGRLKHPGIAQIHVAGHTGPAHGERPYFAMELVDGLPLTRYAHERKLALRERLELLIRICEAVQHAHQVGVIHRDLKPANILVTAEGQPKILDFGVARSTDADLQVTTVAAGQAALIGTLPYMSPEQVRGRSEELDTRSDVHALGILCYELLTGGLPRDLEGKTLTEAIRTVVEQEPRSLAAAGVGRFAADLETIVAKALESDRERRYDSASALAADLRRYLDGQPISARPQSALYQLRKLVLRNRLPAALVAGLLLLAVASAVSLGVQNRRVTGERDRANLESDTANEASFFLESLFLDIDPELALGRTLSARDILDRGAARMETELLEQPALRGRILVMLGKVYEGLGHHDRAAPLLEEAVELGRALRRESPDPIDRSNLELALCLHARILAGQGNSTEAVALCREAVELSAFVNGTETVRYATALNHLAHQLTLAREFEEARSVLLRGLDLRERLLGPAAVDVGWSVYQYAWLLRSVGEVEPAREAFQRACTIWEQSLPENHPQLAKCQLDFAWLLVELGEAEEALANAERALAIQRIALGSEHPGLAEALESVGSLYWRAGKLPAAQGYFAEAVEAHRTALGAADSGLLDRLYTVAFIQGQRKSPEEEATLLEVLRLARKHHGDSPRELGRALGRLGYYMGSHDRHAEARSYLDEAVLVYGAADELHAEDLSSALSLLLQSLESLDAAEASLDCGRRYLELRLAHPDWSRPNPLFVRRRICLDLMRLGRIEEAEPELRALLPLAEEATDVNAFFPWNLRWLLGHCLYARGDEVGARELYDLVLAQDPEDPGEDLRWLKLRGAEEQAAEGRMDEAVAGLQAALQAGLARGEGELALQVNPRLPADRRTLLLELLQGD